MTTTIVQPTPYDLSEAECIAYTECPGISGPSCTRQCTYMGPANCRCCKAMVFSLPAVESSLLDDASF